MGHSSRDRRWLAEWTWAAPQTWNYTSSTGKGRGRNRGKVVWRKRAHNYALMPEPRLFGECVRRGIVEGV